MGIEKIIIGIIIIIGGLLLSIVNIISGIIIILMGILLIIFNKSDEEIEQRKDLKGGNKKK